jgi:phospholipid-binding lipoprotein MlaA|tara:strand:- start:7380 stop:8168 length:789 start_codon:yes stop_codon:yes gene_type:complete
MASNLRFCYFVLALSVSLTTTGCAPKLAGGGLATEPLNDPLESTNRALHGFNQAIDQTTFKPIAKIYRKRLPLPVRLSINNFFRNLGEPTTIVNDILQGKGKQAVNDGARFAINTTLGLLGLLDLATPLGLPYHTEDYGQTLALWGMPSGPYLVLPILGPSTLRDTFGKLPALFITDPLLLVSDEPYLGGGRYGLLHASFRTLHAIDLRAQLLPLDSLMSLQVDSYSFLKATFRQNRLNQIHDMEEKSNQLSVREEDVLFSD